MKDKIVKGVWLAANFNAASVKYLEKDKASDGAEVFKLGQTEYLKADDVLSAVRLLREKIRELPNRDNELRFLLPKATKTISLGKLDGGGIGRFKVMKIIDEVFGGVGK